MEKVFKIATRMGQWQVGENSPKMPNTRKVKKLLRVTDAVGVTAVGKCQVKPVGEKRTGFLAQSLVPIVVHVC